MDCLKAPLARPISSVSTWMKPKRYHLNGQSLRKQSEADAPSASRALRNSTSPKPRNRGRYGGAGGAQSRDATLSVAFCNLCHATTGNPRLPQHQVLRFVRHFSDLAAILQVH